MAVAVILLAPASEEIHRGASAVGMVLGGPSIAGACAYQAFRTGGGRRPAWALAGLASIFGVSGNVMLLLRGATTGPGTGPPLANLCLVLALLLGVGAVILFPSRAPRAAEVLRILLDGLVVGGAVLFFASLTLFPEIVGPDGDLGERFWPLLIPVIDLVAATLALLLFLRRSPADGALLASVSLGFGLFAVSDFWTAITTLDRPFVFGSIVDLGWIAGYLVIAVGVRSVPATGATDSGTYRERSTVAGTALMFAVVLVAAVLSLSLGQSEKLNAVSQALWLMVLLGVAGRQLILTIDNERLRGRLERRVVARSRDLASATQRSDLLVNSVGDGIYGVDRAGRVTFVNPVAARTLGHDPVELIGRNAHGTFHAAQPNGRPFPDVACYITKALSQGVVTTAEEDTYVRSDGELIPVEVTASPATEDDRTVGAVVVFRDITSRLEIDRMKQEFVSVVSHELKTPLTSIRASLALLAAGSVGELTVAAKRMVTIALDSSVRLGRLIEDILDVERIDSGVISMEVGHHDAQRLLESAVAQVSAAGRAGVGFDLNVVAGVVAADADRVVQALINLLDNAIKFSPASSVVRVSTRGVGSFLEFAVADAGRGIPPAKLESVFGRFEQVDASDARERGGTGLGLAISRSIVERLGGRIWAENNAEGGATVRFTLPLVPANGRREPKQPGKLETPVT